MGKSIIIVNSILFILIVLLLSFGYYLHSNEISKFASLSVRSGCNLINETDLTNLGYKTTGKYYYFNDTIVLYETDKSTLKHENCHRVQNINNRSYSCLNPKLRYINEFECYIAQDYPDWLYRFIYGDF